MSDKFKVQLVVDFEFDETQAAHILSDPKPSKLLTEWLNERGACENDVGGYCVDELKKAFGLHLATRKIEEVRQLPLSTGEAVEA